MNVDIIIFFMILFFCIFVIGCVITNIIKHIILSKTDIKYYKVGYAYVHNCKLKPIIKGYCYNCGKYRKLMWWGYFNNIGHQYKQYICLDCCEFYMLSNVQKKYLIKRVKTYKQSQYKNLFGYGFIKKLTYKQTKNLIKNNLNIFKKEINKYKKINKLKKIKTTKELEEYI